MNHCSSCGKKLDGYRNDWKYCPYCGKALPAPSSGGGCYLTTACMENYSDVFDDNCDELTTLRMLRDEYVEVKHPEFITYYYRTAPKVVEAIDNHLNKNKILTRMYDNLVFPTVQLTKQGKFEEAYQLYKHYALRLAEKYTDNKIEL